MVQPTRPPANGFVAAMRKVYNPIGFSKGYNFILFFVSMGYLVGFTLARLQYLSFYGVFCGPDNGPNHASPGECYYYLKNPYKIGMMLHLFCILPAALLVLLQFIPAIRHKFIIIHRINGYLVILLSLISSAGVLIILEHSFGGDFATRTWGGVMVITTTIAYLMAYINIKLLQIDQHRAWMLRAWAYFSIIVTIRIIMFSAAAIISRIGGFLVTYPCAQIDSVLGEQGTVNTFPSCLAYYQGTNPDQHIIVEGSFNGNPIQIAASLGITFGSAGWMAFWLHAVGVEIYLQMTPKETERLKQVSYERQSARGWKRAGYAGLTAQRFGDAEPFVPAGHKYSPLDTELELAPKASSSVSA